MNKNSFPPEAENALRDLYAKYGNQQTTLQKIAILELILDPCHISMEPSESHDLAKLGILEYEWLEREGLIMLEYV